MIFIKIYYLFSLFNLALGLFLFFHLLIGYGVKGKSKHYFLGFLLISAALDLESIFVWSTWKTPARNIVMYLSALIPVALFLLSRIFDENNRKRLSGKPAPAFTTAVLILCLSFISSTYQGFATLLALVILGAYGFIFFNKRTRFVKSEPKSFTAVVSLSWVAFLAAVLINSFPKLNLPKATALFITTGMNLQVILLMRLFLIDSRQYEALFNIAKKKYRTNPIDSSDYAEIKEQLLFSIDEKKLFLEPGLTLKTLAENLKTSPHRLSQVLNSEFSVNFSEFINQRRIAYACRLLQDDPSAKLLAVAYDSGFNNKNSFNQAFKKVMGMPPSKFAKTVKSPQTSQQL